jgi:HEAT repeat protein
VRRAGARRRKREASHRENLLGLSDVLKSAGIAGRRQLRAAIANYSLSSRLRAQALRDLSQSRLGASEATLVHALLDDPSPLVFWEAAKTLSARRSVRLVSNLLIALKERATGDRRIAMVWLLGSIGHNSALEPLAAILRDRRRAQILRAHAAEALGLLGDVRAIEVLKGNLHDVSVDVRFWCVYALGELGGPSEIDSLKGMRERDLKGTPMGWWSIRKETRDAIRRIRLRSTSQR